MRRFLVLASMSLWMLAACGDDDTDQSSDAGVSGSGGSRAGSGGRGGSGGGGRIAGSGGRAAGSAGSGGRSSPSAGDGGTLARAGTGGSDAGATQQVTIRFKGKIGSADFACGQAVSGQGTTNATIQPIDFRFYVQDVKLIDEAGKEVPVTFAAKSPWQNKDVALIDFENGTGLCGDGTPDTHSEITGTVPSGDYHAIVFTNGVPESLNHGDPATLPEPLRGGTLTWGWLLGYRFIKVEVASTTDLDAEVPGGLFHLGSTACTNTSLEDGGVDFDAPPQIACSNPIATASSSTTTRSTRA